MKIVFTEHAMDRIRRRKILEQEVFDAVHFPDMIIKRFGKYNYTKKLARGTIEVICAQTETHIKVVTICWV
ncbi:DUF4258 domain-containing protein [Candidatus Woesearchaeota archaeon]|nr:DUF4258 domain-containing protein [Candidatus Woesearchaeota archaeon]